MNSDLREQSVFDDSDEQSLLTPSTPGDGGEYDLAPEPVAEDPGDERAFCALCLVWREGRVCEACGADLVTGDLAKIPDSVAKRTPGQVVRPNIDMEPGLLKTFKRAGRLGLVGLIAPLIYLPCAAVALTYQTMPWAGGEPFPWPGMLVATFVMAFCVIERTRATLHGQRDLDLVEMGSLLTRTLPLWIILLGCAKWSLPSYIVAGLAAPFFPAVLGAMATDAWSEFSPGNLWDAIRGTPAYLLHVLLSAAFMGGAMYAVWGFPEGPALPRALAGVGGAMLVGALAGAARNDAELNSLPDYVFEYRERPGKGPAINSPPSDI